MGQANPPSEAQKQAINGASRGTYGKPMTIKAAGIASGRVARLEKTRERLAHDVAAFLESGGQITELPSCGDGGHNRAAGFGTSAMNRER